MISNRKRSNVFFFSSQKITSSFTNSEKQRWDFWVPSILLQQIVYEYMHLIEYLLLLFSNLPNKVHSILPSLLANNTLLLIYKSTFSSNAADKKSNWHSNEERSFFSIRLPILSTIHNKCLWKMQSIFMIYSRWT